jgi:hypothetical protein
MEIVREESDTQDQDAQAQHNGTFNGEDSGRFKKQFDKVMRGLLSEVDEQR